MVSKGQKTFLKLMHKCGCFSKQNCANFSAPWAVAPRPLDRPLIVSVEFNARQLACYARTGEQWLIGHTSKSPLAAASIKADRSKQYVTADAQTRHDLSDNARFYSTLAENQLSINLYSHKP